MANSSYGIKDIPISSIQVDLGRRPASNHKVKELADSIKQLGLINPITVTQIHGGYMLVAGLHRLSAVRNLGHTSISANIISGTKLELELVEIDENLVRNELHYTDLDTLTLRRKEIYEEMHPETKAGQSQALATNIKKGNIVETESAFTPKPSFVTDTSQKTGKSETIIKEEVRRARDLIPEAKEVLKEKDIPKTQATELARYKPEEQKKIIEVIEERNTDVKTAVKEIEKEQKKQEREEYILQQKEDIAKGNVLLPKGKFEVINIDPPWAYGTKFDPNGRRVANPYPEMSQEELIYEEHTKIIYFPLKHMIKISDLTDEQIKNIRKFHSGKYDYNKY